LGCKRKTTKEPRVRTVHPPRSQRNGGVEPTHLPKGSAHVRGFVRAPEVLASVQLRQIQPVTGWTCTKRVPFRCSFRRKTDRNRGCDGEPVFARANPRAGRRRPVKPRPISPRNLSPRTTPVLATVAGDRERCLPGAHQRNLGPFPPQERAFYAESAGTFQAMNDLAAKRPDPVM
jgi:hypothetical protein